MKNRILKLALGALVLAGLGFAGYRYMQQRDNVEIQFGGPNNPAIGSMAPIEDLRYSVKTQSYDDDSSEDQE